jgi:hypothetical protein
MYVRSLPFLEILVQAHRGLPRILRHYSTALSLILTYAHVSHQRIRGTCAIHATRIFTEAVASFAIKIVH